VALQAAQFHSHADEAAALPVGIVGRGRDVLENAGDAPINRRARPAFVRPGLVAVEVNGAAEFNYGGEQVILRRKMLEECPARNARLVMFSMLRLARPSSRACSTRGPGLNNDVGDDNKYNKGENFGVADEIKLSGDPFSS
jgi:hypothetical protein